MDSLGLDSQNNMNGDTISKALTMFATDAARNKAQGPYSGDVSPRTAWEFMQQNEALMVDVRTHAEWAYVGVPDLKASKAKLANLSWRLYPDYAQNMQFMTEFQAVAKNPQLPIFFLCKVGGRSLQAANEAASQGYSYCFNIAHGFEGDLNEQAHRGTVNGWKAEGLPWTQA